MRDRAIVLAALVFVSLTAHGQSANPFIGTWAVTYMFQPARRPMPEEANGTLVVTESGGTWRVYTRSTTSDPCSGRDTPIEVKSVDEKHLVGVVKYSSLSDACKDSRLELTRDEQGRVTGRRGQFELTLTKK
jgi:hypothetical protein